MLLFTFYIYRVNIYEKIFYQLCNFIIMDYCVKIVTDYNYNDVNFTQKAKKLFCISNRKKVIQKIHKKYRFLNCLCYIDR